MSAARSASGDAADDAADFAPLGLVVGHATDEEGATGCTVVRGADGPVRGAVAILGRATGTRELALLEPGHLVERVDAVLLTGGSAYGLDAAAGVMRWCEERGRGFPIGPGVVSIVPGAVIFDLAPLGHFSARPTPDMAWRACEEARAREVAEGSVGAGTGAICDKLRGIAEATKGGVGCAVVERDGLVAGAVMVVNAFGIVHDATGAALRARPAAATGAPPTTLDDLAGRSTTIGVVAVGAPVSKVALRQLAVAATGALHRRIRPAGSPYDGDVLFALAPLDWPGAGGPPQLHGSPDGATHRHPPSAREGEVPPQGLTPEPALALALEWLAAEAVERAIERAVRRARGRDGIPGLADRA